MLRLTTTKTTARQFTSSKIKQQQYPCTTKVCDICMILVFGGDIQVIFYCMQIKRIIIPIVVCCEYICDIDIRIWSLVVGRGENIPYADTRRDMCPRSITGSSDRVSINNWWQSSTIVCECMVDMLYLCGVRGLHTTCMYTFVEWIHMVTFGLSFASANRMRREGLEY